MKICIDIDLLDIIKKCLFIKNLVRHVKTQLEEENKEKILKLLDALDNLDDVQSVNSNCKFIN